jgi:hypothetical protein
MTFLLGLLFNFWVTQGIVCHLFCFLSVARCGPLSILVIVYVTKCLSQVNVWTVRPEYVYNKSKYTEIFLVFQEPRCDGAARIMSEGGSVALHWVQ